MTAIPLKLSADYKVDTVPKVSALETDFPAVMLSEVGLKESWRKEVHRPATSTHKWWAKRLGSVFRGILIAAVAESGAEAEAMYRSRTELNGLVVLDPFSGSGVTGVEALKLGARAVCFDINPVATLVQRQAMQPWDRSKLIGAFKEVEQACRSEIDRVHRSEDGRDVLYYFWVAVADCLECNVEVNLFDSTVFSRNAYPKRVPKAQLVCPQCLDIQEGRYTFESARCENGHEFTPQGNVIRSAMTCRNGHSTKILDALKGARPSYRMYAKMVVDAAGVKTYEPITDWDRDLYQECCTLLRSLPASAVLPSGELAPGNNTKQALNWNFRAWHDFFNARQLYSLSLLASAIRDLPAHTPEREAICALFSGTLEFNNLFASFKGEGTGAVRHMFSHHVLRPERTPLEAHPWGTPHSSGSFSTLLKSRLIRADEYKKDPADLVLTSAGVVRVFGLSQPLASPISRNRLELEASEMGAYLSTCNAANTDLSDESVDLVVTDPPYMDNVHYSELADFFHAWLKNIQPHDSYTDASSTRARGEVQHADPAEFGSAIQAVWTECCRVLKPNGLLAFTFHQARLTGWVELVKSLRAAGLVITAVQPVKGEMTTSIVKAASTEPSNLDSVVVCRKASMTCERVNDPVGVAYERALERLRRLVDGGVDVGAGDVRSVVRGSLLAHLDPDNADSLEQVDLFADRAIRELSHGLKR
jgi:putative DNA methylase